MFQNIGSAAESIPCRARAAGKEDRDASGRDTGVRQAESAGSGFVSAGFSEIHRDSHPARRRMAQYAPAPPLSLLSQKDTPKGHVVHKGSPLADLFSLAQTQHYPTGALYVVATPIGNLADITLRALHVLNLVDRIAAEDTRTSSQLLSRYGIGKPLIAAHQHNEHEAAERIVEHLRAGERIAYISDAGTPGISDPGAKIVDAVRAAGLTVVPMPGCSALATALSAAGDWVKTFTFAGFLPTKTKQRAEHLQTLVAQTPALIFYEAPHRIVETLDALAEVFGDARRVLIGRELTKLHESLHVCLLSEAPAWLAADANRQRGEFVLVVEGAPPQEAAGAHEHDRLLSILLEEVPASTAVKLAVALTGASRKILYARALELKQD